ncbi:MAG TPA: PilZ domain-containing protein [Pyrinomonadaceae bacterium]|nr:PilZ domain-containing protein [Pyrinomonadaceae bacterium]
MITNSATQTERRRIQRIPLSLPMRVEGHLNTTETWNEITRLKDVSAFGAGFILKRPVKRGRLLQLTIPLPRQLRCYDFSEPQYKIWGIIRRCIPMNSGTAAETYSVGVAFIGKHPPLSYFNDPAKLFEVSHREEKGLWQIIDAPTIPDESHLPKEDRRHTRFQIPVSLTIETLDENRNVTASEMSVTENISLSGASVFSTLKPDPGSFVRVKSDQYNITIIAVVRRIRMGQDNIPRLHLEFIDRYFPLEGIE